MGGHYGSVQVRTGDRERIKGIVSEIAREMKVKCLVGPTLGEWVGVYPEGNGQGDGVATALAGKVADDVLHLMVHDDDIFAYWFYRQGKLVDSSWSMPGYFGEENRESEEAMRGEPEAFRHIVGDAVKKLPALLDREEQPTFANESLEAFAKVLNIGNAVTAYEYLKEEEGGDGIKGWRKFQEVPEAAVDAEAQAKKQARGAATRERKGLAGAGLLLRHETREDASPVGCGVREGFLVAWHPQRYGARAAFAEYRAPWTDASAVELPTSNHILELASDVVGSRVAISAGDRISVFDREGEGWAHVVDIAEKDLSVAVALTPDGTRVAHLSRNRAVISDVAGPKTALSVEAEGMRRLAIHPSGKWLALAGNEFSLLAVEEEPRLRQIWVGGKRPTDPAITAALKERWRAMSSPEGIAEREKGMEAAMKMFTSSKRGKGMPGASAEEIEAMRAQAEAGMAKMIASAEKMAREGIPAQSVEHVATVGFSVDGTKMWCGTDRGARVYDWASVPRDAGADLTSPILSYDVPVDSSGGKSRTVYYIAEEPSGGAIVFGGQTGRLFRLDLASGATREILALPELPWIHGLTFGGGGMLGVRTVTGQSERRSAKKTRAIWEVWDYARLLSRAV
jgi:hypothetical protein